MFYETPEIKGEIRNLKQQYSEKLRQTVFTYEIFLDGIEVFRETEMWDVSDRPAAVQKALLIGNILKEKELARRELAAVGNAIYVKFSTDITASAKRSGHIGYYGIFRKGKPYCICSSENYTKEEALAAMNRIVAKNCRDDLSYKFGFTHFD
ncbi:hypothetical protein [Microcoleus sp. N9_A1]|uniref:hypothetical protein n=1 Tax=Microcoleus sp. N9_A1 TaxID=3055380 RepID=UPI002FD5A296